MGPQQRKLPSRMPRRTSCAASEFHTSSARRSRTFPTTSGNCPGQHKYAFPVFSISTPHEPISRFSHGTVQKLFFRYSSSPANGFSCAASASCHFFSGVHPHPFDVQIRGILVSRRPHQPQDPRPILFLKRAQRCNQSQPIVFFSGLLHPFRRAPFDSFLYQREQTVSFTNNVGTVRPRFLERVA